MSRIIDLRSDTVTQPTESMRKAMAEAEVGDDVYEDDPTVKRLESISAEISGKAAALFFPSGSQANLCALLSHCQRGEEYICAQESHTYKYEVGGGAVLGSIQPQPLETESDGTIAIDKIKQAIKPDNIHFPITRLLCLENTFGGVPLSMDYMKQAVKLAKSHGLSTHLDGARVFNAATALKVKANDMCSLFDSVSICLSKGLCAPAGTMLCGEKQFIFKARRWRKMAGGGMRQVGILAAAGIIALEVMSRRLQEDHDKAAYFSNLLIQKTHLIANQKTNMVKIALNDSDIEKIKTGLALKKIKATIGRQTRFVFHHDIHEADIPLIVDIIAKNLL